MFQKTKSNLLSRGFEIGMAILVFVIYSNWIQVKDYMDTSEAFQKVSLISNRFQELRLAVREAESNHRAYLQKLEPIYLEAKERSVARVTDLENDLAELIPKMSEEDKFRFSRIRHLAAQKIEFMFTAQKLAVAQSPVEALKLIDTRRGFELMNQIDNLVDAVIAHGELKMEQDQNSLRNKKDLFDLEILFSCLLGLLLLIYYRFETRRELTKYKALASELEMKQIKVTEAQEIAQNLSVMKDDFIANMSHEIRTPLNGIIGLSELLRKTELNTNQKSLILGIKSACSSLLTIVNEILDFSKIEAGQMKISEQDFNLNGLIDEIRLILSPMASTKGLKFTFMGPDYPITINSDPVRLKQVILNLGTNAIKFTETGEVRIQAQLRANPRLGPHLLIEVKDTGLGIDPSSQARIFTQFFQAPNSGPQINAGTGLGLSICKKIIEAMKGKIDFVSTPGQGSTFSIIVPIKEFDSSLNSPSLALSEPAPFREIELKNPEAPKKLFSGWKALIIEDNPMNQVVLAAFLKELDIESDKAISGPDGLKALKNKEYNVVFLDCNMPGMDGFQTLSELRKTHPILPVIAVTANALPGFREKCLDAGMDHYLTKPIDSEKIESTLKHVLQKAALTLKKAQQDVSAESFPLLDMIKINNLREMNFDNRSLFLELREIFSQGLSQDIRSLKECALNRDTTKVFEIAQLLKASSMNLGASRFAFLCEQIEHLAQGQRQSGVNSPKDLKGLVLEIENTYRETLNELKKL
ncbi:MAG: response regulator [Bdellovibrionaceae bacterium]|nr:response regulator [Pseudobdellovibrionaceae bacterium]